MAFSWPMNGGHFPLTNWADPPSEDMSSEQNLGYECSFFGDE